MDGYFGNKFLLNVGVPVKCTVHLEILERLLLLVGYSFRKERREQWLCCGFLLYDGDGAESMVLGDPGAFLTTKVGCEDTGQVQLFLSLLVSARLLFLSLQWGLGVGFVGIVGTFWMWLLF